MICIDCVLVMVGGLSMLPTRRCYNIGLIKLRIPMFDLFQERRIFMNSKRKPIIKSLLPEIKFTPSLPKKMNDDLLVGNNSRLLYSYQPLSNILISKKITPPNPEQITLLISKKKTQANTNLHNFKIRKESAKKATEHEQEETNCEEKRNSSSLSQRVVEESEESGQRIARVDEPTFMVVNGNNNEELVRQLLTDRGIWR